MGIVYEIRRAVFYCNLRRDRERLLGSRRAVRFCAILVVYDSVDWDKAAKLQQGFNHSPARHLPKGRLFPAAIALPWLIRSPIPDYSWTPPKPNPDIAVARLLQSS